MNYKKFYTAMMAIENAINESNIDSQNMPVVAIPSERAHDTLSVLERMGAYINFVTDALTIPVKSNYGYSIKAAFATLIQLRRDMCRGFLSFHLPEPEDMDECADSLRQLETELSHYRDMTPYVFIGACCAHVAIDSTDPDDVSAWCDEQALHLAKYLSCRGIDIIDLLHHLS